MIICYVHNSVVSYLSFVSLSYKIFVALLSQGFLLTDIWLQQAYNYYFISLKRYEVARGEEHFKYNCALSLVTESLFRFYAVHISG